MQITSNDSILLEEFYDTLRRERIPVVLEANPVEGAMGVIPSIEIKSSDFTTMIKDMFIAWLEYKKFNLYVNNKEVDIKDFNEINADTKIDIKFDER